MLSTERRMVRTRGQASSGSLGGEVGLACSTRFHHASAASLDCETHFIFISLVGAPSSAGSLP
jgi:hypothetical protein